MRSSEENPVRSHNLVVQGCAGEESRGVGAVLMPLRTPWPPRICCRVSWSSELNTPHLGSLHAHGQQCRKSLEPSFNLIPTEGLLVHSGFSSSRSWACFSLSLPLECENHFPSPDFGNPQSLAKPLWRGWRERKLLTLPMCQPCKQQGGSGQTGWSIDSQAGVQQGQLAQEAAEVLGSRCHRDQRQQDVLVVDHSGDLDGMGRWT